MCHTDAHRKLAEYTNHTGGRRKRDRPSSQVPEVLLITFLSPHRSRHTSLPSGPSAGTHCLRMPFSYLNTDDGSLQVVGYESPAQPQLSGKVPIGQQ